MTNISIISDPKSRKFLQKIRMAFKGLLHNFIDSDCQIIRGVWEKIPGATLLFVDFSKAFDFIHRGKMEQILFTYGLWKETVTVIMMFYKNTKAMVHSHDGDNNFFGIVTGVF